MTKKNGKSKVDLNSPIILPEDYRPSDKEEFMNPMQIEYFKQKLLDWRSELLTEANDTLNTLSEENFQKPDATDRAQMESEASLQLRTRDRERKLLSKIEAALRRIDDGSYGYCEETDEPIRSSVLKPVQLRLYHLMHKNVMNVWNAHTETINLFIFDEFSTARDDVMGSFFVS